MGVKILLHGGLPRPGLSEMTTIDLLEVEVHCRNVLREKDSLSLTSKELRDRIAAELCIDASLLDTVDVRDHIDSVILSFIEESSVSPKSKTADGKSRKKKKADPKALANENIEEPNPPKRAQSRALQGKSAKEASIDRLKGYIVKCGVRKRWKKELEGLNETQSVLRLEQILRELGMEGRPTLEKCKDIKARKEFEEEMKALDPSNVIDTRLRHGSGEADVGARKSRERAMDDEDETMPVRKPRLDLAALGDIED